MIDDEKNVYVLFIGMVIHFRTLEAETVKVFKNLVFKIFI